MTIWSEFEKIKEKYSLIHWAVLTLMFLGGLFINASYQIIDWLMVPFDNQKDITILLEKSEELSAFFESVKNVQAELAQQKTDNAELNSKIVDLKNQLDSTKLEFTAQVRRLEDGQLQLFLKTERLDERTSRNK